MDEQHALAIAAVRAMDGHGIGGHLLEESGGPAAKLQVMGALLDMHRPSWRLDAAARQLAGATAREHLLVRAVAAASDPRMEVTDSLVRLLIELMVRAMRHAMRRQCGVNVAANEAAMWHAHVPFAASAAD